MKFPALCERQTYENLTMEGQHIAGSSFSRCTWKNCQFTEAHLENCQFSDCKFISCAFDSSQLEHIRFCGDEEKQGCLWQYCDFSRMECRDSNWNLGKIIEGKAYLSRFLRCSLVGIQFDAEAHKLLSKTVLFGGVFLEDCKLPFSVFRKQNLQESSFVNCDLMEADFSYANLTKVTFRESRMHLANMEKAVLDGADISEAQVDLELTQLASWNGLIIREAQASALLEKLGVLVLTA